MIVKVPNLLSYGVLPNAVTRSTPLTTSPALHLVALWRCRAAPEPRETLMKNTQLLLINDMCGYGKVALSAMLPVLSHMGYRIHNLPTALVSDTLNYPKFYIHDTTEYVRQSLAIWEELGFEFDAISTGFIVTEEETRIISDFCHRRAQKGTKVFVDPIMGDNGKLYAGVPESTIGLMRHLLECADYAVPNYTEACLLADRPIAEQITPDEARRPCGRRARAGCQVCGHYERRGQWHERGYRLRPCSGGVLHDSL